MGSKVTHDVANMTHQQGLSNVTWRKSQVRGQPAVFNSELTATGLLIGLSKDWCCCYVLPPEGSVVQNNVWAQIQQNLALACKGIEDSLSSVGLIALDVDF